MNDRVYIFDTTLRDGEQSPGASMSVEQKYEIAVQLERLGVDVIEAGFPVSSPHQFRACEKISRGVRNIFVIRDDFTDRISAVFRVVGDRIISLLEFESEPGDLPKQHPESCSCTVRIGFLA